MQQGSSRMIRKNRLRDKMALEALRAAGRRGLRVAQLALAAVPKPMSAENLQRLGLRIGVTLVQRRAARMMSNGRFVATDRPLQKSPIIRKPETPDRLHDAARNGEIDVIRTGRRIVPVSASLLRDLHP
jgi:hypothetical protein